MKPSLGDAVGLDKQKIIRTVRMIITALGVFGITYYFQVPQLVWSIITIFMVMYDFTTVGGVYKKSLLRLNGTLMSAAFSLLIIYCFNNNPLINTMAFVLGVFVLNYFFMDSDRSYIALIGAVTLGLVFFNQNDIYIAIYRIINILIGITASSLMMRFFFPRYATEEALMVESNLLAELIYFVRLYLDDAKPLDLIKKEYLAHESLFITNLTYAKRIINEAILETKRNPSLIIHHENALLHIRHIFRLLSVFIYYLSNDTLRKDSKVDAQFHHLLTRLHAIALKLNNFQLNRAQPIPASPSIELETVQKPTAEIFENILANLDEEALLLNREIRNIISHHI